jgi:flagellar hook-length control protein FliK
LQTTGQPDAPDDAATPAKEQPAQTEADAEVKGAAASDPRSPVTLTESGEDGLSHDKGENASSHSRHRRRTSPKPIAAPPQKLGDVPVIVKTGADAMPNLGAWAPASQASAATAAINAGTNITATSTVPIAGLAVEIATQAQAGNHRFEIRLDPPELGRIDVRLDIDRDGNVTTRLVADRADTLDLLKRDSTQLERALQQAD